MTFPSGFDFGPEDYSSSHKSNNILYPSKGLLKTLVDASGESSVYQPIFDEFQRHFKERNEQIS